ncbi:MAG: YbjN domain-containing protein [Parachlamydiaceae bacterium]|nr:YbjN domain-containing protein [Parachlamydiaceae bacterium]
MISLKLDAILVYLTTKGVEAQLQAETNQIVILFKIGDREFPLFIRIFDGEDLLQLLVFVPCNMKKSAFGETGRLLHLLNKELDIPGFGLDEDASAVFYRCIIPIQNQQVDETLFDAYLNSIQLVCKSFSPVIATVAFGSATFEEILQKVREQNKNQTLTQSQLRP